MNNLTAITILAAPLLAAVQVVSALLLPGGPFQQSPSQSEIELRAQQLTANQHRDDVAIEQYERIEHEVDRTGGPNPRVLEDKLYRVVPTGTGTMKLLLRDKGTPANPADYHKQLEAWVEALDLSLKPNDSRTKSALAKFEKKKKDRAELIDAMREGFTHKWVGRETINGYSCDVYQLDPNPEFRPKTMLQGIIVHVYAKIWVDRNANQLVRGEAHVVHDISVGGGILGKLYKGGVFFFEQSEVAPGVWLPARYQYDFTARKLFFTFEQHQYIEASHYKRIGTPQEALAMAQSELASGKGFAGDP